MFRYNVWMDFEKEMGEFPVVKEFESEEDAELFFELNYPESWWIIEKA